MIVIDTHVWVWWVNDDRKLKPAVRSLLDAETDVRVSAISMVEIVTAVSVNRLNLNQPLHTWLAISDSIETIQIEPITDTLCLEFLNLPGDFHRDPGDRLIVALARQLDAVLVTADHRILKYDAVRTINAS